MIKQSVLLIAASIAAIFFKNQLVEGIHFLLYGHEKLTTWLSGIFAKDDIGHMIQSVLALIFLPLVVGLACSMIHWAIKKKSMSQTLTIVWVIWAVLLTALLAQAGISVPAS